MDAIDAAVVKLNQSESELTPLAGAKFYHRHLHNCELRDYQTLGADWLLAKYRNGHGAILADEMGLGKTLQTVAFLVALYETRLANGRVLIVCPLSVLNNWQLEFERFAPQVILRQFVGEKTAREQLRHTLRRDDDWRVLITTFEICLKDEDFFHKFHFDVMIVDEGHRLKNSQSQLHQALRALRCDRRFILSGTPIQNNLNELYTLLQFAAPMVFKGKLRHEFIDQLQGLETDQSKSQNLYKILQPFLLRRVKEDVLQSLPKKVEVVLYHGLTTLQKQYYRAILAKNIEIFDAAAGGKTRLLNVQMQLRKCINHPYLFDGVEPEPFELGEHLVSASAKLLLIDRLLRYLQPLGHKVLLFSQMTRMLDILQDYLTFRGFSYERLDGSVRGEERYLAVNNFNQSESTFAFLLSTKAGGVGLNLMSADTVIFVDSDFNPQNDLQAAARVHRIGQRRNVKIIRLIGKHTMEEIVLRRAESKLSLTKQVIGHGKFALGFTDSNDNNGNELSTAKELRDIMKYGLSKLLENVDDASSDPASSGIDFEQILGGSSGGEWLMAQPPVEDDGEGEGEEGGEGEVQHMYMFEGRDYSAGAEPTADDEQQVQQLLGELQSATVGEGDDGEAAAGYRLRAGVGPEQRLQVQLPVRQRRQLTEEEKELRRRRREEAAERRRAAEAEKLQRERERRAKQWQDAGYASLAVRLPGEGDGEEDEEEDDDQEVDEEADLNLLIGSATEPELSSVGGDAAIVCASVDDSGRWGSGGMFAAIDALSDRVGRHYELAGRCGDVSLGDCHLVPTGRTRQDAKVYCCLLVCQDSRQRGRPITLRPLLSSLRRLRLAARRHSPCSVHLPRLGDGVGVGGNGVGWYGVERLLRKLLARRGVPTFIYYFPRRRRGSAAARELGESEGEDEGDEDAEAGEEDEDEEAGRSRKRPPRERHQAHRASTSASTSAPSVKRPKLRDIFKGVHAHLHLASLPADAVRGLVRRIVAYDGDLADSLGDDVTHVVAGAGAELQALPAGCVAVAAQWVHDSVVYGSKQEEQFYPV